MNHVERWSCQVDSVLSADGRRPARRAREYGARRITSTRCYRSSRTSRTSTAPDGMVQYHARSTVTDSTG
jgi:broad specificity phosphatase PhoE